MRAVLLITYEHTAKETLRRMREMGLSLPKHVTAKSFGSSFTEIDLYQFIRTVEPAQVWLDTRMDPVLIRKLYWLIADTLAVKHITCDILSIGDRDLKLPLVIHYNLYDDS